MKKTLPIVSAAGLLLTPLAAADLVTVEINGVVEFNGVGFGEFASVNSGDDARITFSLDTDDFLDSGLFPTRGYAIDQSSFSLTLGSVTTGLQDPFPAGETPYFVLRDNDPAVDGFFLATSPDVGFPNGVPVNVPAGIDPFFSAQFSVTYGGDTLDSLDIADAAGTYDFTGLQVFNFVVQDGPFKPIGMIFEDMTITVVPAPGVLALFGLAVARRRRR